MSHDAILHEIASKLPVTPNARKRRIWIACMVVGAASFGFLLATQPQRAWASYLVNMLFFLGIAMGGVTFAAAIRLCNGHWAGPIQRLGESLSSYLPAGIATVALFLVFGAPSVFPWVQHPDPRQAPYLNLPFLAARSLGGLLLFGWLARRMVAVSLRPDARALLPHVAPELKPAYEKLTEGWRGDAAEEAWQRHQLAHLAPQVALAYAVFVTVMGWDFVMSLTPNWISGLFGWFVWAGAFLSAIAMVVFLATQVRTKYRLEPYVTSAHFWDTGKVMFSFSIFWVYLFWSQYLPIWYANMPEETWWVFIRFEEPWRALSFTVFGMVFLIPYLGLMNKTTKSSPFWMMCFSLVILAGVWLERHVLVMPSVHPERVWLGLPEAGVMLGFLGVFGWRVQGFLTKYPCVNVYDLLHPRGGHGH
uniref:Molybdopterin oxidoreductase n=1 Tax=Eiseniibacteriota bacterium TaxID=2212470 RepID=A0A832I2D6_UNCEI